MREFTVISNSKIYTTSYNILYHFGGGIFELIKHAIDYYF